MEQCFRQEQKLWNQSDQITKLSASNARLAETIKNLSDILDAERLQRGLIGIASTILVAVGGAFVGSATDSWQWFFGSMLFVGCAFILYNSLLNLSEEVREHGIWGALKRLWFGRRSH